MDDVQNRYTTKDLADMLGVEAVTIRKYSLALEKAGYDIERSDGKNRSFTDTDVMAFKYLQSLRSRTGISVESAADMVAARNKAATKQEVSIVRSESVTTPDRYDQRYDLLATQIADFRELFLQQFLQQQQDIARLTEENQELRQEIAETRKELTEARVETAAATEQISGRIENVEGNLREEIRREQEQTRAQLGEILSRVDTYGKKKRGLFRWFGG